VEFAAKVDGALVAQWEALEKVDKYTAAKDCILCARKPTKELVAGSENH
jgi:hypothetical protein